MRGWIIRIAIIAAIAIGAFIFQDRMSSNAGDLAVGHCFDEPTGADEVKDVQRHPCNEAHTSEVIFVGDLPGSRDVYPSDADLTAYFEANCVPAFNAYTGRDYQSDTELDIGSFIPTEDGWEGGDREMTCYAVRIDGAPTAQSVKAP